MTRDELSVTKIYLLEPGIIDPTKDAGARADQDFLDSAARLGIEGKLVTLNQLEDRSKFIEGKDNPQTIIASSRPGAGIFLGNIKTKHARKIYIGHDIHHWRLQRWRISTQENEPSIKQIEITKRLEEYCWANHDISLYPTSSESDWVIKQGGKAIHWQYFSFDRKTLAASPKHRKNIKQGIFIGGHRHSPNRDGIGYFLKNIWKSWRSKEPDLSIKIIGDWADSELKQEGFPNVEWTGTVSENQVATLMDQSGWAIVPIRFGAGIKRKLLQYVFEELPVISTPEGIEGLPQPLPLSIKVLELDNWSSIDILDWSDSTLSIRGENSGIEWINNYYSKEQMDKELAKLINTALNQ